MNKRQRDANRATAQEARAAIRRHAHPLWAWQLPVLTDCMKPSAFMVGVQDDFSTALDQVWVSDSYWSPIRYLTRVPSGVMADTITNQSAAVRALSNLLHHHGWRGNPSPRWPESLRVSYCRQQGLPLNTPEETCRRLQRYGFLTSYAARNDAEQSEMETLRAALLADGIDPGWEEVPRRETTDEDLAVFQIRKERPWHS
jgi:hypothetical protein